MKIHATAILSCSAEGLQLFSAKIRSAPESVVMDRQVTGSDLKNSRSGREGPI